MQYDIVIAYAYHAPKIDMCKEEKKVAKVG